MSIEESNEHTPVLQAVIVTEPLILSVEDRVGPNKDDVLGRCMFPLQYVDRRLDHKAINTRRFNLKKHVLVVEGEKKKFVYSPNNDARDQASELETKVLVDGKQDDAKVVKVVGLADEQNSDEPNVLVGNGVIGVGCFNDKYIKKKNIEAVIQRRLWDLEIKSVFQDNTLR
nr:FT-interacting protein 1-like [Tanacetum cinerariifolium]